MRFYFKRCFNQFSNTLVISSGTVYSEKNDFYFSGNSYPGLKSVKIYPEILKKIPCLIVTRPEKIKNYDISGLVNAGSSGIFINLVQ